MPLGQPEAYAVYYSEAPNTAVYLATAVLNESFLIFPSWNEARNSAEDFIESFPRSQGEGYPELQLPPYVWVAAVARIWENGVQM